MLLWLRGAETFSPMTLLFFSESDFPDTFSVLYTFKTYLRGTQKRLLSLSKANSYCLLII